MQGSSNERTVWRPFEGDSDVYNGAYWRGKKLPITIRCLECLGQTKVVEVRCLRPGDPTVIKEICLGCGRELSVTVEFRDYPHPIPAYEEEFPWFWELSFQLLRLFAETVFVEHLSARVELFRKHEKTK